MPAIFIGRPSTAEQIESLTSYFGSEECPVIPDTASIAEALSILSEASSLIFKKSEKDVRSFFVELRCFMQQKLREGDSREGDIIASLVTATTSDIEEQTALRLSILTDLYNILSVHSNFRCTVFLEILRYGVASDNVEIILPALKDIDQLLEQWKVEIEQKREVYEAVANVYKAKDENSVIYYKSLKEYLTSFEGDEDANLSGAKDAAIRAAVLAIQLEDVYQYDDLLELKAMKQLKSDASTQKIYELLDLFTGQKLDSFEAFNKANPDYLSSVGLSSDDCSKKIKLLSLATLASESNEITYGNIAETLAVEESEVELWVISAISANLIVAKIDQANKRVFISQSTLRVFKDDQWKQLQTKLHAWKKNIQTLLENTEPSSSNE